MVVEKNTTTRKNQYFSMTFRTPKELRPLCGSFGVLDVHQY